VSLFALVLLTSPALFAGTFTAFGPQSFGRSTSAPRQVSVPFDVHNPNTPFTLQITESTVSSAIVTVNGTRIFGTSDFNNNVTQLSAAVTLQAHNVLDVDLRGTPGDGFTVRVIGVDNDLPAVQVTAAPPPNANGWNNSDVGVTFLCSDVTSGIAVCPTSRTITAEGIEVVSGTATDLAGNTASASVTVRLDKTAPAISVSSPAANAVVSASSISVSGTVTDALSGVVSMTCNGLPATLSAGGFSCAATMVPGLNTVRFEAADAAGNSATSSLQVSLSAAPAVHITEPANFSFLNISPITVRGTVSDPSATIKVNGVAAPLSSGAFSVVIPIVEGNNTLTAVATTPGGFAGTGSVQVTLDTTPPRVTIQSPADGFVTTDAAVGVSGVVNDVVVGTVNDQQAQVTVNGVAASVANRSFFAPSIPLALGDNVLQAVGRDRVGNAFTTRITVRRQAPAGARISVVSGNGQSATVAEQFPNPIVVKVTNALGAPVANQAVIFRVVQNNGVLSDGTSNPTSSVIVHTAADGTAHALWIAGSRSGAGSNRAEATATGFDGAGVFTGSGIPGAAAEIHLDNGAGQTGATGQALTFPFIVVATDNGHNRLGGVPVTFEVREGGGSFNGGSSVTVTTDSDGRALALLALGPAPGYDNNLVAVTAPGSVRPVVFTASAKVPGAVADTKITGIVLDNANRPIAGATMRLYQYYQANNSNVPVPVGTPVVTDAQGQFVMLQAPVGTFKLVADGTTANSGSIAYPSVEYDLDTVSGQTNTIGSPIYLPVLDTVNRLCVSDTLGGTLTIPSVPGFALTVAAGSATFPGGARSGCITVTPVHGDKVPMVPGFGQQPRFVVTIQPVGTTFNPPAQISIPNVDGLSPHQITEMYSYDHDLSAFIAIGTGSVSADGSVIKSDPGVGVMKAGWHCGGNPNPTGAAACCPPCKKCDGKQCVTDPSKECTCIKNSVCKTGTANPVAGNLCGTNTNITPGVNVLGTPPGCTPFGLMQPVIPPNPATVTACKKNCQSEFRVAAYSHNVYSGTCSTNIDISGANDSDVTAGSYCDIIRDLTPDATGRARRTIYWSQALTSQHEAFHVTEWTKFIRQNWPTFESTVEAIHVPFDCTTQSTAAARAAQQGAIDTALSNLISATDASMRPGAEDRAYADGKAGYQALANAVCARAKTAGWVNTNACPVCVP
jgi:hypothetical protein